MSKRLGNTYRVERYTKELGVHPLALRLAILSMHHGKQGNLSDEAVRAAQETVDRLRNFARRMRSQTGEAGLEEARARAAQFTTSFDQALDDDLNVSAALAALQTFVTDLNRLEPGAAGAQEALAALDHADAALKLLPDERAPAVAVDAAEIERLIAQRLQARKERRFAEADAIRNDLRQRGILLEDSPQGTTWRVVDPR
jgi:cysteinyl-tRNA synthetase